MEQPPGYVVQGECPAVCKLKKSLYVLEQSPCVWFEKISATVIQFGLSTTDHFLFLWKSMRGTIVLVVYVDDIVITGE